MKTVLMFCIAATALAADYHVINKIKIGGTGGWDYATMDSASRRLYVSHGTSVAVVDVDKASVVGTIGDLHGVHGIALAPAANKGFISNGQSNSVTVFDLKTLQKTGEVKTGTNPDAICYEPKTNRVFTFNGRSNDSTAIDVATGNVVATFPVGKKPEFCVADGAGKLYANIEDTGDLVEIDAAQPAVVKTASLKPCEEPSGLAIDLKQNKLFSVCGNKMMAVTDIPTLKVVATPAIGQGPDAAAFDEAENLAFSSNGRDGTITVVKVSKSKYEPVETIKTEVGARTMALDSKTHRLYLPDAEFGPMPPAQEGQTGFRRPPVLPDTFHVIVVGK